MISGWHDPNLKTVLKGDDGHLCLIDVSIILDRRRAGKSHHQHQEKLFQLLGYFTSSLPTSSTFITFKLT